VGCGDGAKRLTGKAVGQAIFALAKAAKRNWPVPLGGIESVMELAVGSHRVRFRLVEADVVELAEILSLGQHVLAVKRDPLAPQALLFRSQHEPTGRNLVSGFVRVLGPGELGRWNTADAVGRCEIVAALAELDMVAGKRRRGPHHRLER